jgi:hypothetical protein
MDGVGNGALTAQRLLGLVRKLERAAPNGDCRACVTFQGYLNQLERDAAEDVGPIIEGLRVPFTRMQSACSAKPCPPAEALLSYLRDRSRPADTGN